MGSNRAEEMDRTGYNRTCQWTPSSLIYAANDCI